MSSDRGAPTYAVMVRGAIGPSLLARVDRFSAIPQGDQTVLVGAGADQADLFGLLRELERFGIELVLITTVTGID